MMPDEQITEFAVGQKWAGTNGFFARIRKVNPKSLRVEIKQGKKAQWGDEESIDREAFAEVYTTLIKGR